jgi:hypothetical protein
MDNQVVFVLVEVHGVEDSTAAVSAIEALSNDGQEFDCISWKDTCDEVVEEYGYPVIYFP